MPQGHRVEGLDRDGRLRLIATVEDPEAIRAILAGLAVSGERANRAPPGAAVCSLPPERFCTPVEWLLAHPGIP
jgi:hypothetical protein